MSDEVKQVKVDNWGIYFLQRLKHFFNRTDYCDLTLQFQDNAQLKVHRLVLSACTEYFELLERTCEMYEDCLVMPDDLQANVVVPIVNFMYTGQLEFTMDLLESLYQTSQIMNMPVLTKLLDAHRHDPKSIQMNYQSSKRSYHKKNELGKLKLPTPVPSSSNSTNKRSYTKAFGNAIPVLKENKKTSLKPDLPTNNGMAYCPSPPAAPTVGTKRVFLGEPRPTRYELPEELDADNIFDSSFTNISYASQPLMVHPDTAKQYSSKKSGIFAGSSGSKKFPVTSTVDIVECKKITQKENIFEDDNLQHNVSDETDMFQTDHMNIKDEPRKVQSRLFDQILDHQDGPKVTIETKNSKQANNIDHAKIISEVLKKYPHLVKSNKNIKLKILNTPNKPKKEQNSPALSQEEKIKSEPMDFTYETDVLDSKEAARLIALGAENITGPWICLICGTPGRALHFTTYYKFRRHLVEVHNEKPVSKICEFCGLKSLKRNYLLHHMFTKHGVQPPPSYHFPKCNLCNYVALTDGFLIKHKLSHADNRHFRCNVCATAFSTSNQLLQHIQSTGHKYSAGRKANLQCIYCLKVFLREGNLFTHLKTNHKHLAVSDGIIEDSDEERQEEEMIVSKPESKQTAIKYEPQSLKTEFEEMDIQYQIQQGPSGNIQLISNKKPHVTSAPTRQKILNSGFTNTVSRAIQKAKQTKLNPNTSFSYSSEISISPNKKQTEEIIMIDDNEYVMRNNQLIPRKMVTEDEYIISDMLPENSDQTLTPTTSMGYANIHDTMPTENVQEQKMIIKKSANINQPIQIVVSNEEEYKALMNSNHSIIFDDGNANKTLTMLSAPHSATLNATTMDLDNTQSSDMMIIQENYPLNVTEAIPTDNSNIVVVYSHPVDDQNKQYQLITSQGIGTQFVQSSAVIAQSYETITTSTPVMSAHVIVPQAAESWQNSIQEELIPVGQAQMATVTEINEVAVGGTELTSTENENNDSLSELPEVTLTSEIPQEAPIHVSCLEDNDPQPDNIDSDEVVNENIEQVVEEQMSHITTSSTPMDVDHPSAAPDTISPHKSTEIINTNSTSLQKEMGTVISNVNEDQLADAACIVERGIVEHSEYVCEEREDSSTMEQNSEEHLNEQHITDSSCIIEEGIEETSGEPNEESQESELIDNNETNMEQSNVQTTQTNNEVTLAVASEKIQNLASEWSEEDEVEQQEQNTGHDADPEENIPKSDVENAMPTEPPEIEESIENIQQEMDKHMTEGDTEISANSPQEDNLVSLQDEAQTNETVAPQEKISSLLTDWEDNESQEPETDTGTTDAVVLKDVETEETKEPELKKDDKIKSLVSDWDDDEEEIKS